MKRRARKAGRQKKFDMSKFRCRPVAMHVMYLGHNYRGLAAQEDTDATIEHHLFKALVKTCMVEDRASSNFTRCGRTDAGVSAFEQVIGLQVRSLARAATDKAPQDDVRSVRSGCVALRILMMHTHVAVAGV